MIFNQKEYVYLFVTRLRNLKEMKTSMPILEPKQKVQNQNFIEISTNKMYLHIDI